MKVDHFLFQRQKTLHAKRKHEPHYTAMNDSQCQSFGHSQSLHYQFISLHCIFLGSQVAVLLHLSMSDPISPSSTLILYCTKYALRRWGRRQLWTSNWLQRSISLIDISCFEPTVFVTTWTATRSFASRSVLNSTIPSTCKILHSALELRSPPCHRTPWSEPSERQAHTWHLINVALKLIHSYHSLSCIYFARWLVQYWFSIQLS